NAKFQAQATDSKTIENDFRATHFDGDVLFTLNDFKGKTSFAMTKFAKDALWSQVSFHQVFFRKTIFEASSVWRGVSFEEEVAFDSVYFGGKTSFCSIDTDGGKKPTTFKKAGFKNVVFKESDFSEVEFVGNARFNGVVFKDLTSFYKTSFKQKADFRGSIFGGITSFDEADFGSKKPDFLNCTFGNQFNIEHQHLHYEYDDIENEIKNETNTQERKNPSLWRDLFRRLKSNRLAYHNLIDASELRAQELYAREIELEEKVRENKASFKEKIEKWQLCFYRLTSDHHTDLAKIFNNVILLIALFGIFAFGSIKYGEKHLDYERRYFGSVETSAIDLSTRKTTYSLTKSELKTEKQDLQNLSWNQNNFSESFSIVFLCLAFVVSFGALISLDLLKNKLLIKIRNIFFYLLVFGVLIFKPTLLLPFIGKFLESSSSTSFPAMQSLSVVYCILMFLMLFSLQKTARKNSIIPS
ncbi:pentapeptide repeat-containing protein, partial [Helicobacter kayseriensis]